MAKADKSVFDKQEFITPEFRLAFPSLLEPTSFGGSVPARECTMLFPKATDLKKPISQFKNDKKTPMPSMMGAAHAACVAKWGPDTKNWPEGMKKPFKDGDKKPQWTGFAGMLYVKAKNTNREIVCLGKGGKPVTGGDIARVFYPGVWCRANLIAYAYNHPVGGAGFGFNIQALLWQRDDQPFLAPRNSAAAFGDFIVEDNDIGADDEANYGTTTSDADYGF